MSITPVSITPRPKSTSAAATPSAPERPRRVVVVADVDSLTTGNQRGCGDDNPYN